MRKAKSFCRLCGAGCGVELTIDDQERIVGIRGDKDAPISNGYACFKGLQTAEAHHGAGRLLRPLKRMDDGSFVEIGSEQALDEIADKLRTIIARHGPDAVATWTGGAQMLSSSAYMMGTPFREALGTASNFTNVTIDQSCKMVTADRLGAWCAGKQVWEDSDAVLLIGTNPLVAHATAGNLVSDPVKRMKAAKARGLKLVVIDPRVSETAHFADVHLQSYPGEDPTVLSGLLRLILTNGWHDKQFCADFVKPGGVEALTRAVNPYSPEYVAARAGIKAEDLVRAAEVYARDGKVGSAFCATGPSMAPRSNLADHLIESINVVCGRFRRPGDEVRDISAWLPPTPRVAMVWPPSRSFEAASSRIRGAKSLAGERLSCTLAEEIMTPGEGQVRAMINDGGNPATTLPDQRGAVEALASLDLLVTIDPFMTNTAKLSHYVFAPKMQYERADLPMAVYDMPFYHLPWGQYTPEILKAPPGSDLVDDWYVFWGIAQRLGLTLRFGGEAMDMSRTPTTDEMLEIRSRGSAVPLDVIKQYPSGAVFDLPMEVQPAPEGANGRFDIGPDDVVAELAEVAVEAFPGDGLVQDKGRSFSHRLAVRRIRDIVNTSGYANANVRARNVYNPVWMNSADLVTHGLNEGERVKVVSEFSSVTAIVEVDDTVRPGVVQLNHGWGGLPDEGSYDRDGSNVNLLIDTKHAWEPITAMVRMSAIPVNIVPERVPA